MGRKITLEHIVSGMTLKESVKEMHGRILLSQGTTLTAQAVRTLKMWGIREVTIDDSENAETESAVRDEIDPHLLEEASSDAAILFRHVDLTLEFSKELFRLAAEHIVKTKSQTDTK